MHEIEFIPSVPEPTSAEQVYALKWVRDAYAQDASRDIESDAPEDIKDILLRGSIVTQERSIFERDDTKLIPEKILAAGKPLELDDVLGLLHIYFWWNEQHDTPTAYLKQLLTDLDDQRFVEAARVLHEAFPEYCATDRYASKGTQLTHQDDSIACFTNWLRRRYSSQITTHILTDSIARAKYCVEWLDGIDIDEEYEDDEFYGKRKTLSETIAQYAVGVLLDAGVDAIEANDSLNVLEHEANRRAMTVELENQIDDIHGDGLATYAAFRSTGRSAKQALDTFWPKVLTSSSANFTEVLQAYEDVPVDAQQWPEDVKLALARRYVHEHAHLFYLIEDTLQLNQSDKRPFYQRRFAEEYWPPSDRV